MGESPCLRRSFSHPSSASKEGDPFRALTESVSFGRFISESLAWEKWSTFTHNRYLEEAEQFSKPGSVAQKKAFFEAYYKKRAAMKAAALLELANGPANNVVKAGSGDETCNDSPADSNLVEAGGGSVIDVQHQKGVLDTEMANPHDDYVCYQNGQTESTQKTNMEVVEEVIGQIAVVETPIEVENLNPVKNSEACDKILATPEERSLNKEAAGKGTSVLPSNKRPTISSLQSPRQKRASKLWKSSAKPERATSSKARTDVTPHSKKSAEGLMNEKTLGPKSVHMSINFSHLRETKSPPRRSRDSSTTAQNKMRASVYGISKLLQSAAHQSEDRRNKSVLNKSVSGGMIVGGMLQALSGDCSKSSTGGKARTLTVSSPFSFRSEERAAKRKEFFEKLEVKHCAKEAEKMHLQVKSKSPGSKAKLSENSHHGSQSPSNHMKKIPPMPRPQQQKLERKPTPSLSTGTSIRISPRPSVTSETSKHSVQRSNRRTARSVASVPNKTAHENASPNIQR